MEGRSPPIRFAHSGELAIAYQVLGQGPDMLFQLGWPSNLVLLWEHPSVARFFMRLASFSRLILFDPRGSGLSDGGGLEYGLEQGLDDIAAVLDATASVRCAHFATHMAGRVALMFAATYPERTSAVVTFGSHPAALRDEDYPWGSTPDELEQITRAQDDPSEERRRVMFSELAPSLATDEASGRWWARHYLAARSPAEYVALYRSMPRVDIRRVLGSIRCPVLIMHTLGDRVSHIEARRYMAERIPNATPVELPGSDHLPFFEAADATLAEVQRFLTGSHPVPEEDRVLATILFTDIVGSTERAAATGDEGWKALLDEHDAVARSQVESHRGRLVKTTGDGILALFDGPARALRCAVALREEMAGLGMEIRAGLHTGEVELPRRPRPEVHRLTRVLERRRGGNPRLPHGHRPGHRLRHGVRGQRKPSAQGRPGGVAALRRALTSSHVGPGTAPIDSPGPRSGAPKRGRDEVGHGPLR